MTHHYGWAGPSLPDQRDYLYSAAPERLASLPPYVDLRTGCAPIEDQGELGSCTSFAVGAAIRYARKRQGLSDFVTSHLFLYYNSRKYKQVDSGAYIRDVMKSASKQGDCPESDWPYDIPHFAVKPPLRCYQDALFDRVVAYKRVERSLDQLRGCLASGWPVVFGAMLYESFESSAVAQSGLVPLPRMNEDPLGGHCMLIVGYDTSKQHFIIRNSWSTSWGDQGYAYMPFNYLLNKGLSSDFWTIRLISS